MQMGPIQDFRAYEAAPGISVILLPDRPEYSVAAVSKDFLTFFGLAKGEILGKGYLQFLHQAGYDSNGTLHKNLKESFGYLIKNKAPHHIPVQLYERQEGKHPVARYWEIRNVPILDEDTGAVSYLIQTIIDVTDKVHAENAAASIKEIEKAYKFFMHAPVIIGYVKGDEYQIEIANNGLLKVWQVDSDVIGKSLFEVFPELERQGFRQLLDNVRTTGKPFFGYEHPITFDRDGKQSTSYFDFIYQPFHEGNTQIASGIISVGHDVTEKVKAKQTFRNIIEQAQDSILILKGEDMILEIANQAFYKRWGIDESAISKPLSTILPQLKTQGLFELVEKVYRTGESFQGYEMPVVFPDEIGNKKTLYLTFTCQPYREANGEVTGTIVLSSDVTSHVHVKRQYEESQRKWKVL